MIDADHTRNATLLPVHAKHQLASCNVQGDCKMSAVLHWLRLKAATPAPPASTSSVSSRRARRFQKVKQEPAQHVQHALGDVADLAGLQQVDSAQADHAQAPAQHAQHPQHTRLAPAQHAASMALNSKLPAESRPSASPAEPAATAPADSAAPAGAAAAAVHAAAEQSLPCGTAGVTAQQEHTYMDMLSQLRSHMYEDIAVVPLDDLQTAGMHSLSFAKQVAHMVDPAVDFCTGIRRLHCI